MKKDEIEITDWYRILVGEAPWEFMLEVFIRTVVVYIALTVVLRLMGKRMSGQLTISELAVMVTLGAIISVPMQIPERGLLQGLLVLLCALIFHRGIGFLECINPKIEQITQGKEALLVKNGVINVKNLDAKKISKPQLYAALRNKEIYNLGEVKRVYIEACGLFSIYTFDKPYHGLSLSPEKDGELDAFLHTDQDEKIVCQDCGQLKEEAAEDEKCCKNCGSHLWITAIV